MRILAVWRSLVVLFLFAFFGLGAVLINFLIFPLGSVFVDKQKQRHFFCNVIHKTWKFFTELMEKTGIIRVVLENPEKLQEIKSRIIVANHPSFIDIVILTGLLPDTICIAKNELKKNFFMSNIVKSLYLINDEDTEALLKATVEVLNSGFNVIIFPTGTRTQDSEELRLHKGASMMALHSNADIVPVCIKCDYKFLAKNQKIYDAGIKPVTFSVTVNEEIKMKEFSKSDLTKIQLRNRINQAIKEKITTS